jgi:hypothetical protein
MALKKQDAGELHIDALKQGRVRLRLIGTMPLYMNSMSLKAKRDLLIGGGRKTAAQKKELKHDPENEFRDSAHTKRTGDTLLCFPASGVKSAMATAALETPGITKSSVQKTIFLPEQSIQVWGKPYLKLDVVRSADMNRTPDIRSRAFLPRWCAEVHIAFSMPTLSAYSVATLLANAGVIVGIGDFRQEKGRGSYGTFAVAGDELGDWQGYWDEVTKEAREVQQAALDHPEWQDDETEMLMNVLKEERMRRAG